MSRQPTRAMVAVGGLLVLVLALSLGVASCRGNDSPNAEQARLVVDGAVTVTTEDGGSERVTGSATVDFGDVVTVDEGTATLEFAAGQEYELRAAVGGGVGSEVLIGSPPSLRAGDILVTGGFPATLRLDTATVSAQGALKVLSAVPEAAAYAGRTRIDGAGDLDEVLGLRRVVLTASATPEPIAYDGADPWDRRYLGEAIAFGQRLEALARGYTSDLQPDAPRSASLFEAVLPALAAEREFNNDLLDARPAGETLVGAAIVIQGRDGTFRQRWDEVFGFRDAGAAWGLVALDQGVSSTPVLESIELAIGESPLSDGPRPSTPTSRPPLDSPPTSSSPPTSGTTTTTAPPPDEPPPDDDGALTPVARPVEAIFRDVLAALGLG